MKTKKILHPLAKKLGFLSNEDFYKKFPTKGHYEMAMGGTVFPQIQSEKEFFSRAYKNVPAPYTNGSFGLGGNYAGFGEGHPFPYQPRMPKNGREAFGVPTRPNIHVQFGGAQDDNIYNATMDAMGSGDDYVWPTVPGVFGTDFTPYNDQVWPPMYSIPGDAPTANYIDMGNLGMTPERMGGSKSKYDCGGTHKKKGGPADINQGSKYFTNKMNNFTEHLKNTALQATEQKMLNMHMMPDGTMMSNDQMQYKMGGPKKSKKYPKAQFGIATTTPYGYGAGAATLNGNPIVNYDTRNAGDWESGQGNSMIMNGQEFIPSGEPMNVYREGDNRGLFDLSSIFGESGSSPDITSPRFMSKYGGENWIKGAVNPAHKGYCTPMSKETCTPRRKAFARRAKAHFKQEGGEQDQIMQLIQAYAEKVGVDPAELMQKLQSLPEAQKQEALQEIAQEVQGTQDSVDEMQAKYGMQVAQAGATTGLSQKDLAIALDEYFKAHPEARTQDHTQGQTYTAGTDRYRQYPGYGGAGYFPMNMNPYIKFKNVNINGVPVGSGSSSYRGLPGGSNLPENFKMTSAPRLLGRKYTWSYGPGQGESNLPKERSWVGNKLHEMGPNIDKYGTPFPSKSRKEDYAWNEQYDANKANQDSNAFGLSLQNPNVSLPFPSNMQGTQAPNPYPSFNRPSGLPAYLNAPTEQTAPVAQTEADMNQLQENYRKAVEERDRIFKENKINKRGKSRNILGIKYQEGGEYDMTDEQIQKLIDGGYEFEYI